MPVSGDFHPSKPVEIESRREGQRWVLVFRRRMRHSPARVWAALTDPARLSQWAPYTADRHLTSPGAAVLTMIDGQSSQRLAGEVLRAEEPRLLEHLWGEGVLRWELERAGDGTQVTLSHTLDDPSLLAKVGAGWHLCLDVAERLLDGNPVGPILAGAAKDHGWEELRREYAKQLGTD